MSEQRDNSKTTDIQDAEKTLKLGILLYFACCLSDGLDIDDIETRLCELISNVTDNRLELRGDSEW
jgi:hypothetical protein